MIKDTRSEFPGDPVRRAHPENVRQDFKAKLEDPHGNEDGDHDDQGRFPLEGQNAVDDDLEDEGLYKADQAETDCQKHQLRIVRGEFPQRLAKLGKRDLTAIRIGPICHRHLTASSGVLITQASGKASASGETARTIRLSAEGNAEDTRE